MGAEETPPAFRKSLLRECFEALVVALIVALFLRTFVALNRLPLGFEPEPLLIAELNLQTGGPAAERGGRVDRLVVARERVDVSLRDDVHRCGRGRRDVRRRTSHPCGTVRATRHVGAD